MASQESVETVTKGTGFWRCPKLTTYTPGTCELLRVMMKESKLTNFQQRHIMDTIKRKKVPIRRHLVNHRNWNGRVRETKTDCPALAGGGRLHQEETLSPCSAAQLPARGSCLPSSQAQPSTCLPSWLPGPTSGLPGGAKPTGPTAGSSSSLRPPGIWRRRSEDSRISLPPGRSQRNGKESPLPCDRRTQPPSWTALKNRGYLPPHHPSQEHGGPCCPVHGRPSPCPVVKEVQERKEFLADMEALGQGRQYRGIILTEISQKLQEMEDIDHKRSEELRKALATT
nr:UPF0193 protein EVG1 isoform X1 [Odocoileus virginianus texanus]